MGRLAEAESLFRRVLNVRERNRGVVHPDTLISANNLAYLLRMMGQFEEAVPLYRRVLEAQERTLGAEHPDTLI